MLSRRTFLGGLAATAASLPVLTACSGGGAAATGISVNPADPVVATRDGQVRGVVTDGVRAFKNVPFAAPPSGGDRFWLPARPAPWTGVRDATEFGPTPYQLPAPPPIDATIPWFPGADVLNLNVWAPTTGPALRPVIVRIPGGDGETGSNATFDGSRFARDGVVFVSINHRLGIDGFLFLEQVPANLALLDQVAALEWVRDSIGAFGGDPDNVTVVGESAAALMVMPRAEGLFRRAILESGAGQQVLPAEAARAVTAEFVKVLAVDGHAGAIGVAPLERVLQAQVVMRAALGARPDPGTWGGEPGAGITPFQPVVDEDILPARPLDRIATGTGAAVDVLIGTTAEESRQTLVPAGTFTQATTELVARAGAAYGLSPAALARFQAARPGARPGELLAALQTDWYYRVPALNLAEARVASPAAGATYMYEFAWRSPQYGGSLGACHGVQLPFVLDQLDDTRRFRPLLGTGAPQQLATAMHAAWVAFATTGDPGWPRYDTTRRATMRFDSTSTVVEDPRALERDLWKGLR